MKRIVRGAKLACVEKPEYVYPTRKSVVTYDGSHMYIDGVDITKIPTITGTPIQSGHIYGPVIEVDEKRIAECVVRILNSEKKKRSRWL